MEGESGCSGLLSHLICVEDGKCLYGGEEEDGGGGSEAAIFDDDSALSESDDEFIGLMVSRESSFEGSGGLCFSSSGSGAAATAATAGDWLKSARSGAVRWILKTRAYFGFNLRTAYLSVTYLDRFFLRRTIHRGQPWAIQLLSVACLSLAAKMEECRVPALTAFPVEEYHFESKAIQRMELLVLNTLEWRMRTATPFLYLNYFASKLGGGEVAVEGLFHRAIGFIFSTVVGVNLMDHRPSAAAAAAIFAASGQALTRRSLEEKMGIISTCGSLGIDHILSCYKVMIQESQKLQKGLKLCTILTKSNPESPACMSSVHSSEDAIDDPAFSSISCKRRRLEAQSFSSCNCSISNMNPSD